MTATIAHVCGVEFLALASPGRLDVGKCRVAAALGINWALAVEGRPHPAGEVVVGFGSGAEVDAAIDRARTEATTGGLCAVEFSPRLDEVRVEPLLEVAARGRAHFAAGAADRDGWFPVCLGTRADCLREATRLRRVRAGHRSQEGRTP
ncbi:MAG: hypothetical protein EXS37_15150 [Opitutus sp.]|nr:hypothetical protein [Opitutus sp.]